MNLRDAFLLLGLTAMFHQASAQMTSAATATASIPAASVSRVIDSDSSGRVAHFSNPSGRTFAVQYNQQNLPQSVLAVTTPNVADIVSIGYDTQSRVKGFILRSGYGIFYSYDVAGKQHIQDSLGQYINRVPQGSSYSVTDTNDAAGGRLTTAVQALDSLLSKLPVTAPAN